MLDWFAPDIKTTAMKALVTTLEVSRRFKLLEW